MAHSIIETLQALSAGDFIRTTARQLGESESAVSTALSGAGAVLLARLAHASDDATMMIRIASLIEPLGDDDRPEALIEDTGTMGQQGRPYGMPAPPVRSALKLGRGTALLNVAFGPRLQGFVEALANHAAIQPTSARAVIGHAAPLVLKALGVRLEHTSLEPPGLAPSGARVAQLLTRERDSLVRAVPPGLIMSIEQPVEPAIVRPRPALTPAESTVSMGNGGGLAVATSAMPSGSIAARSDLDGTSLGTSTLIGGLVALALLWWFLPGLYTPYALRLDPAVDTLGRQSAARLMESRVGLRPGESARIDDRSGGRPAAPFSSSGTAASPSGGTFSGPSSVTPSSTTAPAAVVGLFRLFKRTLPSNKQIEIAEEGIEGRMITLIENRGQPLERTQWFEFDRLHFQTGSSNLTPDSRAQVQNIADILSSYPAVKIKIGGYTDNVGEPSANQRLSEARAQRVMTELITLGVNALRLEAEGYGEQFAIADNSTSEGRARNRRIAVRVTER
jgi:OmpA-OmpF porin, OOP family